jgi:acetyltransferase/esterase
MIPTANTLPVPGASLHYQIRGCGPVLLLISGGNGDAASFDLLAGSLGDRYTVVAYDRRGFSRSRLDGPVPLRRIETDSDDAHRLLNRLGEDLRMCSAAARVPSSRLTWSLAIGDSAAL